ncbi:MAG TPA: hypothetical protein VMT17_02805 [Anaeromyxobacteraceae bacterium]|nr:hypothetical protein [Anaeromyxobacteraceae bacterium]
MAPLPVVAEQVLRLDGFVGPGDLVRNDREILEARYSQAASR